MAAPPTLPWAARHGIAPTLLPRHAPRGHLDAPPLTDLSLREDPLPPYDQVPARGRLSRGPFAHTSASHDVCEQVLRSDAFGVQLRPRQLPGVAEKALKMARGGALTPVDPPSM